MEAINHMIAGSTNRLLRLSQLIMWLPPKGGARIERCRIAATRVFERHATVTCCTMSASHTVPRLHQGPSHEHKALSAGLKYQLRGRRAFVLSLGGIRWEEELARSKFGLGTKTKTLVSFGLTDQKPHF